MSNFLKWGLVSALLFAAVLFTYIRFQNLDSDWRMHQYMKQQIHPSAHDRLPRTLPPYEKPELPVCDIDCQHNGITRI